MTSIASAVPRSPQTAYTYVGLGLAGFGALLLLIAWGVLWRRNPGTSKISAVTGLAIGLGGGILAWNSHHIVLPVWSSIDASHADPPPRMEDVLAYLNRPEIRAAICEDVGLPTLWERYARLELSETKKEILVEGEWIPYSMYDGHWYDQNIVHPIEQFACLAAAEVLEKRSEAASRADAAMFLRRGRDAWVGKHLRKLEEMRARGFQRLMGAETDPEVKREILKLAEGR